MVLRFLYARLCMTHVRQFPPDAHSVSDCSLALASLLISACSCAFSALSIATSFCSCSLPGPEAGGDTLSRGLLKAQPQGCLAGDRNGELTDSICIFTTSSTSWNVGKAGQACLKLPHLGRCCCILLPKRGTAAKNKRQSLTSLSA